MQSIAVLTSGGLDSCVLVADLARESMVHPLYVRAGLRWEQEEMAALRAFLAAAAITSIRPVEELSVPVAALYGDHWSISGNGVPGAETPDSAVYLPGRNILLLSHAAVWCSLRGVHQIALGTLQDNPFSDASPQFFAALGNILSQGLDHEIEIVTPYRTLHKSELIREHADLPLEFSLSCMAPVHGVHCGDCNKCHERQSAFADARIPDKTTYEKTYTYG